MYDPKKAFSSLQWSDRSYRRGLVLGLTVAELFLLLLFILLLALALLYEKMFNELGDREAEIAAWEVVEEVSVEKNVPKGEAIELILAYPEHVKDDEQEEKIRQELKKEKEARQEAEQRLADIGGKSCLAIANENSACKKKAKEQSKVIGSLSRRGGRDPSCWATYDTNESQLEKVEFIFNVGVFDSYLVVNDRKLSDSPKKQMFLEEKRGFPLEGVRWDKPMSDPEFLAATEEIFKRGKSNEIRDYSCVFHVLVWDMTTSEGKLKDRWKNASERVLGQRFYTFTVFKDRWPGPEHSGRL